MWADDVVTIRLLLRKSSFRTEGVGRGGGMSKCESESTEQIAHTGLVRMQVSGSGLVLRKMGLRCESRLR